MTNRKLLGLCLIPVILLALEIFLWFNGMQYSYGSWVMSGENLIGHLAIYGMYFLPFISLIPEIIGFKVAAKQRSGVFRIIYIIELLLTSTVCILSVFLFIQSLHTK
ncbi:hypothetical protein [Ruminococcus sp.]|uniref:hypothetical protein n=1 Tax=Ruminococcus sp. TaxID=41978 RepID=UPI0025F9D951|nr:hypothetical protein [Ruminococcus sp.]